MKEKQTTSLPRFMLYEANLKPTELITYIYFIKELHFKNLSKKSFKVSPTKMAKELNISINTIKKSIKSLEEKQLINIEEKKVYYISKRFNSLEEFEGAFDDDYLIKVEFGGYVEVPDTILYNNDLTAAEKTAWIKIKSTKLDKVHINGIATTTNTSINTFKKQIKSLKEKGYINYTVQKNGSKVNDTEIIDLELKETKMIVNENSSAEEILEAMSKGEELELSLKEQIKKQAALKEEDELQTLVDSVSDGSFYKNQFLKAIEIKEKPASKYNFKFIPPEIKKEEYFPSLDEIAAMC